MKDELDLSAVMAGAVDFASSAAASADEADNSTFAMQAKIMALIANHRPAGRRPNSHSMKRCENPICGAVGHVISECFCDGGGLASSPRRAGPPCVDRHEEARAHVWPLAEQGGGTFVQRRADCGTGGPRTGAAAEEAEDRRAYGNRRLRQELPVAVSVSRWV